ncbi:MAG: hypothetical protein LBD96_03015 [Treponema sp.]|jgi:hypothetical protein|nr:hypothetical protein [Treponema sp.]
MKIAKKKMKKIALLWVCGLFWLSLGLLLPACDDSPDSTGASYPPDLVDTVYAGEDDEGAWVTFAFIDEGTVYYFPDNAGCYDGTYDYADGSGRITAVTPRNQTAKDNPVETGPGAFTISADGKTITFAGYLVQGERSFKRVRDADAVDEDVPFTYTPLTAGKSLNGTVWAATAYRTKDWTTLTITDLDSNAATGTIQVSHSFDCTSFPRIYSNYAYDTESTLAYIGPFKIKGNSFTFLDFYGHGGVITLKRMR